MTDHPSNLGIRKEGQNRFCSPLVVEQQGYFGRPRVSPLAEGAHVFLHLFDLGFPGLAVHKEMVTGLRIISAAQPAPVRRQLVDFVCCTGDHSSHKSW